VVKRGLKELSLKNGCGDPNDDVQALMLFNNSPPNDPAGVVGAVALLHWEGQFFGSLDLGSVNFGQKINVQLAWDRANHQFVASWTDVATGVVTQGTMPYSMADASPAAVSDKLLGVRAFTPNCLGQRMFSDLEATFDNVMIRNTDHKGFLA
jgi:hypothetical protein